LLLIGNVIRRRQTYEEIAPWLSVFLLIYLLIELKGLGLEPYLPDPIALNWRAYGIFLGSVMLRFLGSALTQRVARSRRWNIAGFSVFAILLAVSLVLPPSALLAPLRGVGFAVADILFVLLVSGAIVFSVNTVQLTLRSFRHIKIANLRNRLFIWGIGILFLFIANAISLIWMKSPYTALNGLGATVIAYSILAPRVFRLGVALRRILNSFLALAMELATYGLFFLGIRTLFRSQLAQYPWVLTVIFAVLLALLISPLVRWFQEWLNRVFFGRDHDIGGILRDYSQSISNVLDLELLSVVIIENLQQALEVESGDIFLVELEATTKDNQHYILRRGKDRDDAASKGIIPANSALAQTLGGEQRTLFKGEIDLLPAYQNITASEQNWLSRMGMEVHIPVHAQDEWVGLLVLGPKTSREPYYAEDIELLGILADQTAVALQNVLLVENIMQVNSEFRKAYAAMEEAHTKLQRLDRVKSDFISITSHELRTPLAIISGYSQMLMEDTGLSGDLAGKGIIEGIYNGSQRLHEIIDNMLEVAKIDMQELELQKGLVKLDQLLRQVCRGYAQAFRERDLKLRFDKKISDLPNIEGDFDALQKVFDHLLSNAIKYTPDGGTISITGNQIPEDTGEGPKEGVEIIVRDTGVGIDPRYQELIFTKFYQTGDVALHSTGKTKFKGGGAGLGLTIVRGFVEAHGGRVWADSPGYDEDTHPGSAFHVVLPID
jgi:signal transduction histidine kinase